MAEIQNLQRVVATLRARAARAKKASEAKVSVSFSTNYALFVHENLEAFHPNGQAKYLEQPARQLSNDGTFRTLIRQSLAAGQTTAQALLVAGLRLQREAQLLVPVKTGNLRASAATTLE